MQEDILKSGIWFDFFAAFFYVVSSKQQQPKKKKNRKNNNYTYLKFCSFLLGWNLKFLSICVSLS